MARIQCSSNGAPVPTRPRVPSCSPVSAGVWGLPVPHPQPLMMAIGRPISVAHTDLRVVGREAFEAAVDKTLQQVVGAFRELYGKRHSMYGRGPKVLEVC